MVAAVVRGSKTKDVRITVNGKVAVVEVGQRVSSRRLRKLLKPFGNDFLLGEGVNLRGVTDFKATDFTEKLLFRTFCQYVKSVGVRCGRVGVFDPDGRFTSSAIELLSSVSELVIVSHSADEELLEDCIKVYGTCPDVCPKDRLFSCDVCFCAEGLSGFSGVLFGSGGITVCGDGLALPSYCDDAVKKGADPLKLAALLDLERDVDLENLLPEYVLFKGTRIHLSKISLPDFQNFLQHFDVYTVPFL